jgi:hypothetical protein
LKAVSKFLDRAEFLSWLEEQIERYEHEATVARQLKTSEHSGQMIPAEECYARQYEKLAENFRTLAYKHIIEEGMFDIGPDENQ